MLLERWSWAKDGDGQVVLLAGEAGHRQVAAAPRAARDAAGERHIALSHYCSPYHTNSALYPVIAQLERAAGFASQDQRRRSKLAKLEALLAQARRAAGRGRAAARGPARASRPASATAP